MPPFDLSAGADNCDGVPATVTQLIIHSPSDFTLGWLKSTLGHHEKFTGSEISNFSVETVEGGVIARMVRVKLEYTNSTPAPKSVLIKYAADDPGSFGLARDMGLYEFETRFYQDVAPLLGSDAPIPDCYWAAYDDESGQFTLIIQDLADLTKTGNVFEESTPEECQNVLGALTRLQAPLWNSDKIASLPWLADPTRTYQTFDAMPAGLTPFLDKLGEHFEPKHVSFFETVLPRAGEWARSWTSQPSVVLHGDFRSDNMLHATSPAAPPVTVIDFQTARLGPPGVDVAYALGSALSTENRRKLEHDLVAGYHQKLVAAGVKDYDFDAAWTAYRAGTLYGVFLFVGTGSQVEGNDHARKVVANQALRYADMAIDLESHRAAGLA